MSKDRHGIDYNQKSAGGRLQKIARSLSFYNVIEGVNGIIIPDQHHSYY